MSIFKWLFHHEPPSFEQMAPEIVRRINRGLGGPVPLIDEVALYGDGKYIRFKFGNGMWEAAPSGGAKTAQEYADIAISYINAHLGLTGH